ncbi:MAG: hypothetical protein Q9M32_03745 [Sulfurimonas sp.]|nr:hypothetical protein [Sulfurimonas sp.]MDQ7059910.1 hypothetical protein [Sulfurimonas sp.]
MQILILTNNIESEVFNDILSYHKALAQNVLLVDESSLYEKKQFIYAKECMVLNKRKILENILLSPSIVIDMTQPSKNIRLENYLKSSWINTQQVFYEKEKLHKIEENKISLLASKNLSNCVCYIDNNEMPVFKVIEDSITLNIDFDSLTPFNSMGLIEQAITEFFADNNFFSQFEWSRNRIVSNHQSMAFFIQFEILQRYGDYTIENIEFQSLSFPQLLEYNKIFVFNYFDTLLDYRLDRYIEQVKFRTHIIKLCDEYKIDLEPSYNKTFILRKDKNIGLQRTYYSSVNSQNGISIINDKHKTNVFLRENGFNANLSYEYILDDLSDKKSIEEIPLEYPIALKPTDKKEGYGVVTNILNAKRMLISVEKMLKLGDIKPVLLEEFFEGVTYRVLVVSGEVSAVLKYIPVSVMGDGESSLEDLIKAKNIISKSRVRINNALRLSIFNDSKRWETILPKGEKYIVSHNSHASNGGQSINVTDIFDDRYKKISEEACKSLGLKLAGIDMIVNSDGEYRIIEINCGPALAIHVNPKHGTSIATYTKVLNSLLKEVDIEKEENSYLKDLVPYHE